MNQANHLTSRQFITHGIAIQSKFSFNPPQKYLQMKLRINRIMSFKQILPKKNYFNRTGSTFRKMLLLKHSDIKCVVIIEIVFFIIIF
jgi:hypothetical protein